MQKRTREILALVLLGVLLAVGVGAMAYYIFVGHNWNVAASNIDDSIGQMEGYTVFLYEGTHPTPYEAERISDSQPMLDDESRGDASAKRDERLEENPVSMQEAAMSYREKGATVFTLDVRNLSLYSEPFIVAKSGKRVAIMSLEKPLKRSKVRKTVKGLEERGAQHVVALTDDVKALKPLIGEVTISICGDARSGVSDGEWRSSTYCVGVPYEGEVQAILMSPAGVLSSKTIDEL